MNGVVNKRNGFFASLVEKFRFFILVVLIIPNLASKTVQAQQKTGHGKSHSPPLKVPVTTSHEWIQTSLDAHNFFRSLHGSARLVLNDSLSEISQYYANHLLQRSLQTLDSFGNGHVYFEHSLQASEAGIGENLYYSIMTSPIDPIPSSYAVLLWYEEIKDYDFAKGRRKSTSDPKAMIGHLTQLLWAGTTAMGTAYAAHKFRNNQTIVFVVANYYRQGNIVYTGDPARLYLKNVLPPSKSEADINAEIVTMNVNSWISEFDEPKFNTRDTWRSAALEVHNFYRKLHGSQELRLNSDMCKVGQLWAENLLQGALGSFNFNGVLNQIRTNFVAVKLCHMGESAAVFISGGQKPSFEFVVKSWYKQKMHYDFEKAAPRQKFDKTEKFQQLVWNASTEFCISYASAETESGQYLTYVVANYYPAMTQKYEDRRRNVFGILKEVETLNVRFEEKEEEYKCSSVASTILIILLILIASVIVFVVIMLILRKYQKTCYNTIMKFLGLKKY